MNKWSQEELAKRIGYSDRSTIARLEHGEINLSQSKIMQLAEIFGITAGELMGDDGCEKELVLTDREKEIINMYKTLSKDRKNDIYNIVKVMYDQEVKNDSSESAV